MFLLVAGVRHRTASIEVREKISLNEAEVRDFLPELLKHPAIEEAVILSTCNRTEFYIATHDTAAALSSLKGFLRQHKQFDWDANLPSVFLWLHEDAALHLFRVSAGLDSLILGEGQIQGQVKEALATATRAQSAGNVLNRLFKTALTVGKRVRSETGIDQRDVSVSRAAFEYAQSWLEQNQATLTEVPMAILGGGVMAEIILELVQEHIPLEKRKHITVVNRSEQRLRYLTGKYGCPGLGWDHIPTVLSGAKVVFVATGAPHIVIGSDDFEQALAEGHPRLVIDIAVPRNVDANVGNLPQFTLVNTDNLAGYGGFCQDTQSDIIARAESLIYEEFGEFYRWMLSRNIQPTIKQLREKLETIRVVETASCTTPMEEEALALLDMFSKSLINKILHEPSVRLRTSGKTHSELIKNAETLKYLFALEDSLDNGLAEEKSTNLSGLDSTKAQTRNTAIPPFIRLHPPAQQQG